MYLRIEDILDEAISVSEKSIYILLTTSVVSTIVASIYGWVQVFLIPPLLASSYFFVDLIRRLYVYYSKSASNKTVLLLVLPSYATLTTMALGLAGIFTALSYILVLLGLTAILFSKIVASKRDIIVIT